MDEKHLDVTQREAQLNHLDVTQNPPPRCNVKRCATKPSKWMKRKWMEHKTHHLDG